MNHIAEMAMLIIPEEQAAELEQEFTEILACLDEMPEPECIDTTPEPRMQLREDGITPLTPRAALLRNAPHSAKGCMEVRKNVE